MTDNPATNTNPTLVHRQEKAAEHLLQESVSRMNEVTASTLEIYQKNIALGASVLSFWSDSLRATQSSIGQMVEHTQRMADQVRRSA